MIIILGSTKASNDKNEIKGKGGERKASRELRRKDKGNHEDETRNIDHNFKRAGGRSVSATHDFTIYLREVISNSYDNDWKPVMNAPSILLVVSCNIISNL